MRRQKGGWKGLKTSRAKRVTLGRWRWDGGRDGAREACSGKRVKEEVTHVIGVEALAHAGGHIESALQRTEPHQVWNVVAEKPQGPEPREQRAGRAASRVRLHRGGGRDDSGLQSRWKPRTGLPERLVEPAFAGVADSQALPVPLPIASAKTVLGAIEKELPPGLIMEAALRFRGPESPAR